MALTNEMILLLKTQELAKAGILKYTGKKFKAVNALGEEVILPEVEPIHTFKGWEDLGYVVKKGQTSEIKFQIWHYDNRKKKKKKEGEEEEKAVQVGRCYMRTASWFRFDQVEPLKK